MRDTFRYWFPSVLTLGALVSGLFAVRLASEEEFGAAVACVLTAAVLDALDGHCARYLDACTDLGFELDSLCDLANFGVTPSLVVYFWAKSLPRQDCWWDCKFDHALLWAACCCYTACCAYRLARFNVAGHADEMEKQLAPKPGTGSRPPPVCTTVLKNCLQRKLYFKGVPAPVGAAYALTPLMLQFSRASSVLGAVGDTGSWAIGRHGTAITLVATAAFMISPLPTFSSKMLKTYSGDSHLRSRSLLTTFAKLTAAIVFCYACWTALFDTLILLCLGHLVSIPVAVCVFARAEGKGD